MRSWYCTVLANNRQMQSRGLSATADLVFVDGVCYAQTIVQYGRIQRRCSQMHSQLLAK